MVLIAAAVIGCVTNVPEARLGWNGCCHAALGTCESSCECAAEFLSAFGLGVSADNVAKSGSTAAV